MARAYDEDEQLDEYVWQHYRALFTELERKVYHAVLLEQKARAYDKPDTPRELGSAIDEPGEQAELADGEEGFRRRARERVLREHGDEVVLNRCWRCRRLVATPQAKMCHWCGLNWRGGWIGMAAGSIRIRPYQPDDVDRLFEAASESIAQIHPWMPWCHPTYARKDAESWVKYAVDTWEKKTEHQYLIESAEGRFLGGCGLNSIEREQRFANLGYWVRSSATRQGAATEATLLLRDWAFANTDLERLEIVIAVGNAASARVAEKAGALLEGTLRARLRLHDKMHDAWMYSLVRA